MRLPRRLLSVALTLVCSGVVHAQDCVEFYRLARVSETVALSRSDFTQTANTYCNEYRRGITSTANRSAGFKLAYEDLSSAFGLGSSNSRSSQSEDTIASRVCGGSDSTEDRNLTYTRYAQALDPQGASSFVQCVQNQAANIQFGAPTGSNLPKSIGVTVRYITAESGAQAEMLVGSSPDVSCQWQGVKGALIVLRPGGAILLCTRARTDSEGFITILRQNPGTFSVTPLTINWPAYDTQGIPVNRRKEVNDAAALLASMKGAVMPFAMNTCPAGWRPYEAAFGQFIRGVDQSGKGIDPAGLRQVGSFQGDAVGSHQHAVRTPENAYQRTAYPSSPTGSSVITDQLWAGKSDGQVEPNGGPETRPKNVALLYCERTGP